jgi:hypothetical protein
MRNIVPMRLIEKLAGDRSLPRDARYIANLRNEIIALGSNVDLVRIRSNLQQGTINNLRDELRDLSVDLHAAQYELAQIKAKRSAAVSKGNRTRANKASAFCVEKAKSLRAEIDARQ